MPKIRVNVTIQDWYNYIGNSTHHSTPKRVMDSIPYEFKDANLYNLKYKKIKGWYYKLYRVHFTVIMTEEKLRSILEWHRNSACRFEDATYKVIKGCNEH